MFDDLSVCGSFFNQKLLIEILIWRLRGRRCSLPMSYPLISTWIQLVNISQILVVQKASHTRIFQQGL